MTESQTTRTARTVAIVDDTAFDAHRGPSTHPERPERLYAARRAVADANPPTVEVPARPATRAELERVHASAYLEALTRLRGARGTFDADTYLAPGSVDAALRAAGGAVDLVREVVRANSRGVALLRPPGHHARADRAMGFCLLNNIAVAAADALARGIERVAIIDWDVHHGNGTQDMFYGNPHVLFVSLHQWPFYPGTGSLHETGHGDGSGFNVNVPLSAGAANAAYRAAFQQIVTPVVESFAPQLLLVSAGFDAHKSDPLAGMQLDDNAYAWMTTELVTIANKSAHGRLALLLEGGYDLAALESSLAACLRVLGESAGPPSAPASPDFLDPIHERDVERARRALAPRWKPVV